MRAVEIADNVFWVGAVDWNLRDFHGYSTERGSTYNAFLLRGKVNVLVDTVKVECADQLIANIRQIMDPADIDIIVSHHAEMDHSGALPQLMELAKPKALYVSSDGEKALRAYFHAADWPFHVVNDGDILDLGSDQLEFRLSKMLHWPDSMMSFLQNSKILFSNDIFGQHLASSERFDDEIDDGELEQQAAKYFANIFYPLSAGMRKHLAKNQDWLDKSRIIACDHGVLWRKNIARIVELYQQWCSGQSQAKAVIVYDSMWNSTAKLATAITAGLATQPLQIKLFDLRCNHRSDVLTQVLDAKAVVLGSPVFNNGILPRIADFVSYLKGLRPQGKIGAAFGSYGWSNTCVKQLNAMLEEMKIEVVSEGVSCQYRPDAQSLEQARSMGRELGQKIIASLE